MEKITIPESAHTDPFNESEAAPANGGLPQRLLTAFDVAAFVGCHEETVRRAYLRGLWFRSALA